MGALGDKRIVITGASSGIGEHVAYALARQGAKLALGARGEAQLREVAKRCESLGAPKVLVVPTDVGDREACKRFAQESERVLGGIDVLVNNAGITMWTRFDELRDLDLFERIFRVNYLGSVYCT
jgi:NAD(P)-dependent dehydrogenase (short-subunit alcohol dehydrogenase family)